MKFRSAYSERISFPCPSGERYKEEFVRCINPNTKLPDIKKSGEHDLVRHVQEAAKGNLVSDIVRRSMCGDPNAIGDVTPDMFGDITNVPNNLLDSMNMLVRAQDHFNDLPTDIKKIYNNNYREFLEAISSGSFFKDSRARHEAAAVAASNAAAVAASKPLFSEAQISELKKVLGGSKE